MNCLMSSTTLLLVVATTTAGMVAAAAAAAAAAAGAPPIGLPNCTTSCGGVSVPFPFGISLGCYLQGFALTCDASREPPRLLLGGVLQVTDISLANSTVRVRGPKIDLALTAGSVVPENETFNGTWGGAAWGLPLYDAPYTLSPAHNEFILTGCDLFAELIVGGSDEVVSTCGSVCGAIEPFFRPPLVLPTTRNDRRCKRCSGISCCQAPVLVGLTSYTVRMRKLPSGGFPTPIGSFYPFSVLIAEEGWFDLDRNITILPRARRRRRLFRLCFNGGCHPKRLKK